MPAVDDEERDVLCGSCDAMVDAADVNEECPPTYLETSSSLHVEVSSACDPAVESRLSTKDGSCDNVCITSESFARSNFIDMDAVSSESTSCDAVESTDVLGSIAKNE
jgi:hypothetical protein